MVLGEGKREDAAERSRQMKWVRMENTHLYFLIRQGDIFSDEDGMTGGNIGGRLGVHGESATGTQVSGGEDRM